MVGMSLNCFMTLGIISGLAAFLIHYVARYRMVSGTGPFFRKWILALLGAWVASSALGHWWEAKYEDIYVAPALLGSLGAVLGTVLVFNTVSKMLSALSRKAANADEREGERRSATILYFHPTNPANKRRLERERNNRLRWT